MISKEDRKTSLGMDASTSISESVHATLTVGLKVTGTIHLDNVTAERQTQANKRGHEALVTGR